MKNSLVIFLLLLGYAASAQNACHPTFSEIYNFDVNDVFVISTINCTSYDGNSSIHCSYGLKKITVISKTVKSDTVIYGERVVSSASGKNIDTIFVTYIDSANALLNKCQKDSLTTKPYLISTIGIIEKDVTLIPDPYGGKEIYRKGLGLFSSHFSSELTSDDYKMIAYTNISDTLGIIPTDEEIKNKAGSQPSGVALTQIYPNPASNKITIECDVESGAFFKIDIIDLTGNTRNIYVNSNFGGEFKQTFDLKKYFYTPQLLIVRIIMNDKIQYQKLLYNPE